MNPPLVTVTVVTYNHASFVRQAIESILQQRTTFDFQIMVADDCSTDGTAEILQKLAETSPNKLRIIHRPKNVGMAANFTQLLRDSWASGSKYIAHLDGDDYWSSKDKLQTQVEFLERDEDCVLSTHNSYVVGPAGAVEFNRLPLYRSAPQDATYDIRDYLAKDFFHSSSMVYRNGLLRELPGWYKEVFSMDYFLVLFLAVHGRIHFRNAFMSVYRTNPDSISHHWRRVEILANTEQHLAQFDEDTSHRYTRELQARAFAVRYGVTYYSTNYLQKIVFYFRSLRRIWAADRRSISIPSRFKYFIPARCMRSYYDVNKKNTLATTVGNTRAET